MNEAIGAKLNIEIGDLSGPVDAILSQWDADDYSRRMWAHDGTLWAPDGTPEVTNRLGWLDAPNRPVDVDVDVEFDDVVLLGMGGSSLAPEVFSAVLATSKRLLVLDSTHPHAIERVHAAIDLSRTVFVVSSKSGGTLETLSLFRYFWAAVGEITEAPGRHFLAVTDPGSSLEELAKDRQFTRIFLADPTVGGRYSALTAFGQVPGRLIGADVDALLSSAAAFSSACGPQVRASDNPGLRFGAIMGAAAQQGRDKLTLVCTESLHAFPAWMEQLVAESTGKGGHGILPVAGVHLGSPAQYASDRLFVRYGIAGDHDLGLLDDQLKGIGAPLVSITLSSPADLGAEIFRAEMATAAAGSVLGINPFDQPDVQAAKKAANDAMAGRSVGQDLAEPLTGESARSAVGELLSDTEPPEFVALMAYLPQTPETESDLEWAQAAIRDARRTATTLGFGPRFLHSTGQYHKGGPNRGVFIQILDAVSAGQQPATLSVPETDFTFGRLIAAQAAGDAQALADRNRTPLRVVVEDGAEFRSWLDA